MLLPIAALPILLLGLSAPQSAHAQSEFESFYDIAPGMEPLPDERRDDEDVFDDDDPGLNNFLDRLEPDRGGGRPETRRRPERDRMAPDEFDTEDDEDRRYTPRERERDFEETEDPTFKKAEPDLGHKVIAGLWSGTVEEVGSDPYTVRLSLKEDGSGTAAYAKLDCASEVVPIAGRLLEYRETITMGRDKCADGFVQLRLRRGLLLWTWKDDKGEIRAAATLKRDVTPASDGSPTSLPEKDRARDDRAVTPAPAAPPTAEMREQAAD